MSEHAEMSIVGFSGTHGLAEQDGGLTPPALFRSLFWNVRRASSSQLTEHAPFLFWLVGATRPERIAVLGVGEGDAHFLLCQALEQHQISGKCYGYGFWRHPKTGAPVMHAPKAFVEYADRNYPTISEIIPCGSISDIHDTLYRKNADIIFLDAENMHGEICLQMGDLESFVGDQAIVVVYGINSIKNQKEKGSQLIERLRTLQHIEMKRGNGLGNFCVGGRPPVALGRLLEVCEGGIMPPEVDIIFKRLGADLFALQDLNKTKKAASAYSRELKEVKAKFDKNVQEILFLKGVYEKRNRTLAETQSSIFDLQAEQVQSAAKLAELTSQARSHIAEIERLKEYNTQIQEKLSAARDRAQSQSDQIAEYREREAQMLQEVRARDQINKELQESISALEAERDSAVRATEEERQARCDEVAALVRSCEELQESISALEAERDSAVRATEEERQARCDEVAALVRSCEELQESMSALEAERDSAVRATEEERQARFREVAVLMKQELEGPEDKKVGQQRRKMNNTPKKKRGKIGKLFRSPYAFFEDARAPILRPLKHIFLR